MTISRRVAALAIFLAAALMFTLEPMVGKLLLPRLGGTPMVWNTCLVVFQALLLAGYAFAHLLRRAPRVLSIAAFLGVAVTSLALLPVQPPAAAPPDAHPGAWLALELLRRIGLPFLVLAAVSPLLQHWVARSSPPGARSPFGLYAASNTGSFAGLLSYPLLIEPGLTLRTQRAGWALGYAALVLLLGLCAWLLKESAHPSASVGATAPDARSLRPPGAAARWQWLALAALPSSLTFGFTTYLTTDVAAVPLLWMLPLALYLLTFVLAFAWQDSRWPSVERRLPLLVCAVMFLVVAGIQLPIGLTILLHSATFFAIALVCHSALARRRPDPAFLTEFYLLVSAGGVAGGLFNVLLAPMLFTTPIEYAAGLAASAFLPVLLTEGPGTDRRSVVHDLLAAAAAGLAAGVLTSRANSGAPAGRLPVLIAGAGVLYAFSTRRRSLRFGLTIVSLYLASLLVSSPYGRTLYRTRTFFGSYHVTLSDDGRFRSLYHGTTLHGMQSADGSPTPLTYYHPLGPIGQAFHELPALHDARNVAGVGLGVGSLSAYISPGQRWWFFEIDPAVERIARDERFFSFLERCGDACRVIVGDARLSLTRQSEVTYDAVVLDAFSSDAVPVHLLTNEAFAEYRQHLSPDGVIALHISNRYVDLRPVVAALVQAHHLVAFEQLQEEAPAHESVAGLQPSHWVVMSAAPEALSALAHDSRWRRLSVGKPVLWTDEYSNVVSLLRLWR